MFALFGYEHYLYYTIYVLKSQNTEGLSDNQAVILTYVSYATILYTFLDMA